MAPKPKLLQALRANLRLTHFSSRTEEAYSAWARRYVRFRQLRHPADLGEAEAGAPSGDCEVGAGWVGLPGGCRDDHIVHPRPQPGRPRRP
ncbi:MAG: phage integrase N-terminal SAM-like domain-containing protein [Gemmatimonadetes bacterium]|nr:phage integrase N-terminal SAM-like domain-containing protein [Gemmatimonadota bacterium]